MTTHCRYGDESDCWICESNAEFRAERAASEAEARVLENRYERGLWGDR